MPTFAQIRQSLEAAGQPYHVINLGDAVRLIATQRGARLLGPFLSDDSASLFWTNDVLTDPAAFTAFIEAGEWNVGGERVWIAPEIQFNIRDRDDFWGTHGIPHALDPGDYTLLPVDGQIHFRQQMALDGYNTATGTTYLDVSRTVTEVANPLKDTVHLSAWMKGVRFAGYAQTVTVTVLGGDPMYAESWNLVQLNAGGTLTIPASHNAEVSHYFGQPRDDAMAVSDGAFRVELTGDQQYKTGYKAAYLTGRMAYLNQDSDGTHYLLVRQFDNDPSTVYCEEPPNQPGMRGHSVHVYNDGGQFGGNGEMEANGRTVGGDSGHTNMTDTFNLWLYVSEDVDRLKQIGNVLLGVSL
jgi:hypothetical protein